MSDKKLIRLLDNLTINQIAAGEVIEDASSVIKELVENALDAGATSISIETIKGGQELIRVSDNGSGISREDLPLAPLRHATSKISTAFDLQSLMTLGFRGEALASIASISKMTITTKRNSDQIGHALYLEGGNEIFLKPATRTHGTTIEVRSLFYNVPVRKGFQKSASKESAAIARFLIRCALFRDDLSISWSNDSKEMLSVHAGSSLLERIAQLFGGEFAENLFPFSFQEGEINVSGYLGVPAFYRKSASSCYLNLNRRIVSSPFVIERVVEGYGTRLPIGETPAFVLDLSLPPAWVDVNVHPQKKHVRLCDEEKIGAFIVKAISTALEKRLTPALPVSFPKVVLPPMERVSFYQSEVIHAPAMQETTPELFSSLSILCKIGAYLIAEVDGSIILVDSQRAYARTLYDAMVGVEKRVASQRLLFPLTFSCSSEEALYLQEHLETLHELGFQMRVFGERSFIIEALPQEFETGEVVELLQKIIDKKGKASKEELAKRISTRLQKRVSSTSEGKLLVEALFRCKEPNETPDGKTIYTTLSEEQCKKMIDSSGAGKF